MTAGDLKAIEQRVQTLTNQLSHQTWYRKLPETPKKRSRISISADHRSSASLSISTETGELIPYDCLFRQVGFADRGRCSTRNSDSQPGRA